MCKGIELSSSGGYGLANAHDDNWMNQNGG
jgi:hypothetical protein